jgi:DNA-directed RNA polymerase specialized sigma24 family protein
MQKEQRQQLSQWVDAHTAELLDYARQRVSDPQLAEDLVQETFLAAMQGL